MLFPIDSPVLNTDPCCTVSPLDGMHVHSLTMRFPSFQVLETAAAYTTSPTG